MNKYKAVGANIFAGGFSVGTQKYFDVDLHLEHGTYGKNAKELNMPWVETKTKPWPKLSQVEYIFTNPPCAPWSMASAGRQTSWREDPRLECFVDCFNLIHNWPNFLSIESVLATWRKAPDFLIEKAREANELGYAATIILHNGAYLGLPQQRQRMFFVAHNLKLAWHTYEPKALIACDDAIRNPAIDYSDDLILEATEHVKYLLAHRRPEDNTLLQVHDRLGFGKGIGSQRPVFTSALCKIGKPAPTLIHCMNAHPIEHRYLSIKEMSRLSGYPDWWSWNVKSGVQARASLIARGVTPTVGEWLAKLVYDSLEWNREADPEINLIDILHGQFSHSYLE